MHVSIDDRKEIIYQLETDFHLSIIDKLCIGRGGYGYTPMKFGPYSNFAFGTAYDFYVSPYCIEGSECTDIYHLDSITVCLVNTPEGILIKNFDKATGESRLSDEFMRDITRKHGYLTLDRFQIQVLGNIEQRLARLDSSEWRFDPPIEN